MKIFHWKINLKTLGLVLSIASLLVTNQSVEAFPIYAQQAYANPR